MSSDGLVGPTPMATKTPTAEPDLLAAAQSGDNAAFDQLADQYRRQLHAHCYRMLGSLQDAEDALQETLLAAWRGIGGFEGRSSLKNWLYRIATNECLRLGERRGKRLLSEASGPPFTDVHNLGDMVMEPVWLEPYPHEGDPAASFEQRENIELAFVAALQHLPATQRAVLILREVLAFSAAEVAELLDTSVASVNSSLQRARKAIDERVVAGTQADELRALGTQRRRELVSAFIAAWEQSDVDAILAMLTEDVRFSMPPFPAWFLGREDTGRFLTERTFQNKWGALPIEANGQLAFALYRCAPDEDRFTLSVINVFTLRDGMVAGMTAFLDPALHRWFDLPSELVDENLPTQR